MDAANPEFQNLKSRLKNTWMAGDFSEIAKHIESAAEAFIGRLNIKTGEKVLDVACGSGNLAIVAAKQGADVTGVDIATNLIEAARGRASAEGLDIRFDEGDAESLPYEDNSFDTVVSMFGAMFAPRPDMVASELVRVCRPGGRIAMANWTPEGFAGQMFKLAGKYLPPPNMPRPVEWGIEQTVRERFGDNVADLDATKRLADMKFDFPPADVVELFRQYFGPTRMAFDALDDQNGQSYRSDLESLWSQNNIDSSGGTLVKGEYLEVVATKK
jgi:ubiquinone/menaquinone biosynthesis C-methylase UbiE